MKLSDYAKKMGITYRTAWNWFKSGDINAVQMPSGTIIVKDEHNKEIIKEIENKEVSHEQKKKEV